MTLPRSLSLRSFQGEILSKIQSLENKDKKVFVPQWHFRFIILLVESAPSTWGIRNGFIFSNSFVRCCFMVSGFHSFSRYFHRFLMFFSSFLLSLLSSIFLNHQDRCFVKFLRFVHYDMRLFLMVANHRVVQRCDVCDVSFQSILVILVVTISSFSYFSETKFQFGQEGNLFWR